MAKPRIGVLIKESLLNNILSEETMEELRSFADIDLNESDENLSEEEAADLLVDKDGALVSWGVTNLTPTILEKATRLQIWSHAAGSIKQKICDEAWEKGVVVTSAAPAIADDVAELTMAFITMGLRRAIPYWKQMQANEELDKSQTRTLFKRTVGVVSASHVGQRVIKLLRPYEVKLLLYDPFVSDERAAEYGAQPTDLETMARESDVVTIHAPQIPETHHLLNGTHFKLMKDDTVFVNTSRGDNIDEAALIEELLKGRLFAFLDVTSPEPPVSDNPLRNLPNVMLTPHVAGPQTYRVGAMAVEELRRHFAGESQLHKVTRDMLPRIA